MEKRIDLTQFEIEMEWELSELADCIPDLVAELKRSYKEIDALQGKINNARDAMNAYANDEIDNVCEAYEEVCLALG